MNDDKNLLDLPNELLIEIFLYCSIRDLCRLPQTSKRLRNVVKSNYLWYQKWLELVNVCGLSFADYIKQPTENDNYHSRCKRLWNVCQGFREDCELPVCEYCKFKTCTKECLEKYERKISIDIGSKVTWFVTSTFLIQRHPSVIIGSISKNHSKDCIYRIVCNKTELSSFHKERRFCLICNRYKDFRIGVDQDDIIPFNNDDKPSTSKMVNDKEINPISYNISTEFSLWADLHRYFQNKFPNCKLFSPLDSLIGNADFNILEHYLYHIFDYFKSLEEIRKPNVSFIFCLPFNADFDVQKNLIKFMFETMQASRICFVNKALCIALLIGTETCLVVDSGASNTVVSVIVNNDVLFERTQHCQVGGTSISNYLAQVIKLKGFLNTVNAASLDDKRVKASCFLSYNIAAEEKRKVTKKQNIFVRCTRNSQLQKLEMGSELYLAPEIMYAEMNLPNMIKQAISGLDENVAKEALSHLLLTGNNTELNGFATRLLRDLQTVLPRFAHVVDVRAYAGSRSWDAAVGATRVPLPDSNLAEPGGSYFFITREEYVLHGHAK
ncbi:actin, cytoplasmic-like [Centruroides vittatus]|uniref:actin, cytoplasmic-like n=1 Tax=Centruroides vittatus TaxID=120091 RepID=UPI00350F075A